MMSATTIPGAEVPREASRPAAAPRPTFLYIGVGKAGSTWIFEALKAHPQVFVPPAKDIYYFSRAYERGPEWYASFFKDAGPQHRAIGELSINYLLREDALRRIGTDLPEARILISLRNPISRAWSAYTFLRRNKQISGTFREAIDSKIKFVSEAGHYMRYLEEADRYLVGNEVKIVLFDDLLHDAAAFGRQIFEFLGVDPAFEHTEADRNPLPASTARSGTLARLAKWGSGEARNLGLANLVGQLKSSRFVFKALYKPIDKGRQERMTEADREVLLDLYSAGIAQLSARLGRDLSHWLAPPPEKR